MPKILQIFKRPKRRKGRLRRALGLSERVSAASVIEFPQVFSEVQEEYPDYEIISGWLKLADEMLGSAEQPQMNDYRGNGRKRA